MNFKHITASKNVFTNFARAHYELFLRAWKEESVKKEVKSTRATLLLYTSKVPGESSGTTARVLNGFAPFLNREEGEGKTEKRVRKKERTLTSQHRNQLS